MTLVPAGTGTTVVSQASFPMTREVSSALYFVIIATYVNVNHRVGENTKPERTGGNILKVSYNVLYRQAFSYRSRHSGSPQDAYAVTRSSLGVSS